MNTEVIKYTARDNFFREFGSYSTNQLLRAMSDMFRVADIHTEFHQGYPSYGFSRAVMDNNGLGSKVDTFMTEFLANGDEWRDSVEGWKENQEEV